MHGARRLLLIMLSVVSVGVAGFLLLARGAAEPGLRIDSSYILVRTERVSRTVFAYTYRARVINAGSVDMLGVIATLTSRSSNTVVVDSDLSFGSVLAGATVTSNDTFTMRQDRRFAFNPADLVWQISGTPVPSNTPPVANNDMANTDENLAVIINVVANDTDTDGTINVTTVALETESGHGTVGVNGDGTVTYTPAPGFFGSDSFTYTVQDNAGAKSNVATVMVTVQEVNDPPVANAGKDLRVETGMPVMLDGSASFDLNGNMLQFSWRFLSVPPDSTVTEASLVGAMTAAPRFIPDVSGDYALELDVSDGVLSDTDTVVITATPPNVPPNANAGLDQTTLVGMPVLLNGTGSNDPDNGPAPLKFRWFFVARPPGSGLTNANISGAQTALASFTPDVAGTYRVRLEVFDGAATGQDGVRVQAMLPNVPPNADAGPDITIPFGQVATLDGGGSNDPDNGPDPLVLQWTFVNVPSDSGLTDTALQGANTPTPSFLPDVPGVYLLRLDVSDGAVSAHDQGMVIANDVPVATDDAFAVAQDTTLTVSAPGVLSNDSDVVGGPLTAALVSDVSHGMLTLNANGSFTYTPGAGFSGSDGFTYQAGDGMAASNVATVTITVAPFVCPAPTIAAVTPTSGPVGTEVTITGTNLDCGTTRSLAFNGVPAIITSLSPTVITTFIPLGGQDGLFTFTTEGGTVTAPPGLGFDVVLSRDFSLVVAPVDGQVLQGTFTTYTIELRSVSPAPFTGLATLDITGLPPGVTAAFTSPTLTGGQRTTLTVSAEANAPLGSTPLTLRAMATVDARLVTRMAPLMLNVLAGNRIALLGQFTFLDGTPLAGVALSLAGQQTQTDGGGNFQFLDLPAGTATLSVNATPVDPQLPMYSIDVTLQDGEVLRLPPFRIHPPLPPERYTPSQNATQDQTITDPRFPGAAFILPAGVTIIGWDGKPKTQMAIERLSPDQLPVPPPPGPTRSVYQPFFGTPMGGLPSAPIPVTLPNDLGLQPGEKAELWYYDAAPFPGVPGAWRLAGMSPVSADGATVVSENPQSESLFSHILLVGLRRSVTHWAGLFAMATMRLGAWQPLPTQRAA